MVVSANSNFYVKSAGTDRIAITNTTIDIKAMSNVTIRSNIAGTNSTWKFDTTGNLTAPGTVTANYFSGDGSNVSNVPISWTTAPVSNASSGTVGQAAYDSGGNLFICVATNTWTKITGTTSW